MINSYKIKMAEKKKRNQKLFLDIMEYYNINMLENDSEIVLLVDNNSLFNIHCKLMVNNKKIADKIYKTYYINCSIKTSMLTLSHLLDKAKDDIEDLGVEIDKNLKYKITKHTGLKGLLMKLLYGTNITTKIVKEHIINGKITKIKYS